jgi:hypothetical protein
MISRPWIRVAEGRQAAEPDDVGDAVLEVSAGYRHAA